MPLALPHSSPRCLYQQLQRVTWSFESTSHPPKTMKGHSSPGQSARIWVNSAYKPASAKKKRMGVWSAAERAERGANGAEPDYADEESSSRLCDSGLPDPDVCDVLHIPPRETPVVSEAWSRGRWLLGLLVLQSTSSVVLDAYQDLLKHHLVVTLFLTMLVGAGGNAGNQSAIKVIRGLVRGLPSSVQMAAPSVTQLLEATGTIQMSRASIKRTVSQQLLVGVMLATGLSAAGFARVFITDGSLMDSFAISTALFTIVITSVVTGTVLPFGLAMMGFDPANAGTTIQVWCDITGCLITCITCRLILEQASSIFAPA